MMRRGVLLLATMALAILAASGAAQAIINGEPDRNRHPYVGMMYNDEFLCSGTLISPTVFLTAGHCVDPDEVGDSQIYVTFEARADFEPDDAVTGTGYAHPRYEFPFYDVGVVVLDEPVRMERYARLPEANLVDDLEKGTFLTAVGYGVRGFEVGDGPPRPTDFATRYTADVRFLGTSFIIGGKTAPRALWLKVRGGSMGQGGEGICFGDSGGPMFLPDQRTVVAVNSFLINRNCAGLNGGQRVDLPVVLNWVRSFL
jgi:hypothetical protein